MAANIRRPSWEAEDNTNTINNAVSDPLAILYNEGLWRVNTVSPLYNLQYTTLKLKQYATKIRQALVSGVQSNSTVKYVVQVEEQHFLKYFEDDANGLMVTVSTSQGNNTKVSYIAVLLTWGKNIKQDNATHLPYMLERGEQRVGTVVKQMLQTAFDCNITQCTFVQRQLLHFVFNFVDNDTSRSNDPFTLVYRTPQVDVKDKLSFSFDVGDIRLIWNKIKHDETQTSKLVDLAYRILQNQIFSMSSLDVTVFDLCEVKLPKAEVKTNGTVKMKTPEIVNCVFNVLNEICNNYENDLNDSE